MIQSSVRIEKYHYAIRHVARAAEALARAGREVIYLNIGDPQVYGFDAPASANGLRKDKDSAPVKVASGPRT